MHRGRGEMEIDSSDDVNDDSGPSEPDEDVITEIFDRDDEEGSLIYLISLRGSLEKVWFSRSDLWDEGTNTDKIEQYDFRHPVDWDDTCYYCELVFGGPEQSGGCEECRCETCDAECRHYKGVNYGCVRHPVI